MHYSLAAGCPLIVLGRCQFKGNIIRLDLWQQWLEVFFRVCVFSLEGLWTHSQLQQFTYDASFGSWGAVCSNNSLKTKGEHKIKHKHNKRPARRWEKFESAYCGKTGSRLTGGPGGPWGPFGPSKPRGPWKQQVKRAWDISDLKEPSIYSLDATLGIKKTLLRISLWHLLKSSLKSANFSCIFRYITAHSVINVSSQVDAAPPSGQNTLQQYKSPLWRNDSILSWMIL